MRAIDDLQCFNILVRSLIYEQLVIENQPLEAQEAHKKGLAAPCLMTEKTLLSYIHG